MSNILFYTLKTLNKYILSDSTSIITNDFNYKHYNNLLKKLYSQDTPFNRSFLQYKAQSFKNYRIVFCNLFLFVLLPIFLLLPIIFLIFFRKPINQKKYDYVAILPYVEIIPNRFQNNNGLKLSKNKMTKNINLLDIKFMYLLIFKSIFNPYFLLKNMYTIFQYSGIAKMNTNEILVSNEYSFTSSILTEFFNMYNKKVSNCMHGEKVLCLRDCFSYYDNFYVWDEYYIKLLQFMNVKATFLVDTCDFIKIDISSHIGNDIIFFLQGFETKDMLENIHTKLNILSNLYNKKYYVKAHPRYKNNNITDIFTEDKILNINSTDAINKAAIIASNYSTVLFQVYINRKKNNCSYPLIAMNDLIKLPERYIMLNKADIKFSNLK